MYISRSIAVDANPGEPFCIHLKNYGVLEYTQLYEVMRERMVI
jgi:hypothetical protein